jgi:hypothetical protein
MEPQTFLEHYRVNKDYDGSPREISRSGPVVFYQGKDERSGAPVSVALLPIASVAAAERESFEEKARAALQLDHMNTARLLAFGAEGEQFAFVSELSRGETLEAWVTANEPMPPEAVLRVALQVVNALNAVRSYGLTHRAIRPSNLVIVPGQTAEGGWPFVKLTNFGLPGLKDDGAVSAFSSPEQIESSTSDFRSEIYSLGATMCFLLTGAFYAEEPRSQARRLARPLRKLIVPMLSKDPDERPSDPVLFERALRKCLQTVERRQVWARKFGIPPIEVRPLWKKRTAPSDRLTTVPVPLLAALSAEPPLPAGAASAPEELAPKLWRSGEESTFDDKARSWISRPGLAWAVVLLALLALAAVLLPAPVSLLLRGNRDVSQIGVPVGVPPRSVTTPPPTNAIPPTVAQAGSVTANAVKPAVSPKVVAASSPVPASPKPPPADSSSGPNVAANSPPAALPPPAEGPQTVWERAAGRGAYPRIAQQNETAPVAPETDVPSDEVAPPPNESASPNLHPSKPGTSGTANHATKNPGRPVTGHPDHRIARTPSYGSSRSARPYIYEPGRSRYAHVAPDGSVILRFPDGQTFILPPLPGYYYRGQYRIHHDRVTEGRPWFLPPGYDPGD